MKVGAGVLTPAVAGTWYPARRDELAALVDRLIDDAHERGGVAPNTTRAVIAPHAGYTYSGAVAAMAFRCLEPSSASRAILLGPSHYFGFGGAAVPATAVVQRTPLGDLPLDREAIDALSEAAGFRADDRPFAGEHALEVEVPFLQHRFGHELSLVPILLGGGATRRDAARVAAAVAPFLDARTIVVASSDFTHYGPRFGFVPFVEQVPERLRQLDLGAARLIAEGDADGFARLVDETGATICGRRAIDVLLRLPIGRRGGSIVDYDTSGRMTNDWSHSVSYASLTFPGARPGLAS